MIETIPKPRGAYLKSAVFSSSAVFLAILMVLSFIFQSTSALSITSLSQTQGPTTGGNSTRISGTGFIEEKEDKIVKLVSSNHCLAISESGKLYAWGDNSYGQLGTGDTIDYSLPQDISDLFANDTVVDIAVGSSHSVVVTSSGKIYTWGANDDGQLGNGNNVSQVSPQNISGNINNETVAKLAVWRTHNFVITESGKVFSWGNNSSAQLGIGTVVITSENLPQDITSQFGLGVLITDIDTGNGHTIAVSSTGSVYVWGSNGSGQAGVGGTLPYYYDTPHNITSVFGGDTIKDVAAGGYYNIAISDSKIYEWGSNEYGQLADGTTTDIYTPTDMTSHFGGEQIESVSAGVYHSLFLTSSNRLLSVGRNNGGQLGDGSSVSQYLVRDITSSFGGDEIISIASGTYSSYAITGNGLFSWGQNSVGQLGTGNYTNYNTPQNITTSFPTILTPQISSIYFGSSKVEQFQVIDANTISLIVPPHSAGFVDIIINNVHNRTTTLSNGYEYITIGVPNTGVEYE